MKKTEIILRVDHKELAEKTIGPFQKEVNATKHISERITNLLDLEALHREAYYLICDIRKELEKENPSMDKIDELSKPLHLCLLKIKDFEFRIERRKVITQDDAIC